MSFGEFRYAAFDGSTKQHGFLWGLKISSGWQFILHMSPLGMATDKTSLKTIQSLPDFDSLGGNRAAYGVRGLSWLSFTCWKRLNGLHIFLCEIEEGTCWYYQRVWYVWFNCCTKIQRKNRSTNSSEHFDALGHQGGPFAAWCLQLLWSQRCEMTTLGHPRGKKVSRHTLVMLTLVMYHQKARAMARSGVGNRWIIWGT